MDLASVGTAYQGLKVVKDIITGVFDAKVEAEAKPKILEALQRLGEAQDTLFSLREELFKLQTTNNELRQQLVDFQAWQQKAEPYDLWKTAGGAVVYRFRGDPEHFICPSCFDSKKIHILQDNRMASGKYRCPGCTTEFPVNPKSYPIPQARPTHGPWD